MEEKKGLAKTQSFTRIEMDESGSVIHEAFLVEDEIPREPKPYMLRAKAYLLTYPQCATTKEVAVERIEQEWDEKMLKCFVVGHEKHKDGGDHLHVVLCFYKRYRVSSSDKFDFIGGKHGDIKIIGKGISNAITYACKGDDFIARRVDVESHRVIAEMEKEGKKEKKKVGQLILDMMSAGAKLKDVREKYGPYYLLHKKKIEDVMGEYALEEAKKKKKPWIPIPDEKISSMSESDQVIARWLNENIQKPREFRQKQLYIWGPKRMGKSTLISKLHEFLMIYSIPTDEEFYDHYNDHDYDLCVMEEFKGNKKPQWLNMFLDGQIMNIRRKGVSSMIKTRNYPTIIISNFPLNQAYVSEGALAKIDTLEDRLEIVEVTSFINVL